MISLKGVSKGARKNDMIVKNYKFEKKKYS